MRATLLKASDFAGFKRARIFKFLHVFPGKNDVLGRALHYSWSDFARPGPPVRSKIEIYGLASNDAKLQRQADEGMLLARESCALMAQQRRRVPEASSLESAPGTVGGPDGPMWLLQDIRDWGSSPASSWEDSRGSRP